MGRRIVLASGDLFFTIRIRTAARAAGVDVVESSPAALLDTCRRELPNFVVLDLHGAGDPLAAARALKTEPATRDIRVIGFYSHVEDAIRRDALAAGVEAMPRSAFTAKLPELLAGR